MARLTKLERHFALVALGVLEDTASGSHVEDLAASNGITVERAEEIIMSAKSKLRGA